MKIFKSFLSIDEYRFSAIILAMFALIVIGVCKIDIPSTTAEIIKVAILAIAGVNGVATVKDIVNTIKSNVSTTETTNQSNIINTNKSTSEPDNVV